MQGHSVTTLLDSAVASRGLEGDSVTAVLQVIIASLTVSLVTVIEVGLHLMCATQIQAGVFASLWRCRVGVWKAPTRRRLSLF